MTEIMGDYGLYIHPVQLIYYSMMAGVFVLTIAICAVLK